MSKSAPARKQSTRDFVAFMKDHADNIDAEGYESTAFDYRKAARIIENLLPEAAAMRVLRARVKSALKAGGTVTMAELCSALKVKP